MASSKLPRHYDGSRFIPDRSLGFGAKRDHEDQGNMPDKKDYHPSLTLRKGRQNGR